MQQRGVVFVIFEGFQPLDLVGPHEVETMRRVFHRTARVAPSDYRDRFRSTTYQEES